MAVRNTRSLLWLFLIQLVAIHTVLAAAIRPVQSLALIANLTRAGLLPSELQ